MYFEINFNSGKNSRFNTIGHLSKRFSPQLRLLFLNFFWTAIAFIMIAGQSLVAQDAKSVLRMMHEKQQQRWQNVEDYTTTMSLEAAMGMQSMIYNERITVDETVTFRQIPQAIYDRDMQIQAGFPPPEEVSAEMAKALKIAAPHMNQGGPAAAFQLDWDQMIAFAEAGAVAYDSISDGTTEASMGVRQKRMLLEKARLVGLEQVVATSNDKNGSPQTRKAYHIMADDLSEIELEQTKGEEDYQLSSVSWWIDAEEYVPLAFEMNGEIEKQGKRTPISIGGKNLDYRQVGPLYESHTNIYQISGMMEGMSDKDRKDMEKAKEDMAKAKEELAKMSPEQQAMMKKMMGNKLEEMENMIQGDNFETRMDVVSIAINEGPPSVYGLGSVDDQPALTQAIEDVDDDGSLVAQLDIRVGPLAERGEVTIHLVGDSPFPMASETVSIKQASGYLFHKGNKVEITQAKGSISIDYRSETHIRGTYSVDLFSTSGPLPTINGTFKSPAPLGPGQAPVGSPIPASIFSGNE